MRSFLIVLGVASLVVFVAEGLSAVGAESGRPLALGLIPDRLATEEVVAATVEPSLPFPRAKGVSAAPDLAVLSAHLESRGIVGQALKRLLEKSVGQQIAQVDRSFTQDYYAVLAAWRTDPARYEEDLQLALRMWEEVRDPGFRWAMSWFFQAVPDERLIEPLTELLTVDAWRMVDAIAAIGTDKAAARLAAIAGVIENPEARCQAAVRVARSGWEGATRHLAGSIHDLRTPPLERLNAVECLGLISKDPEALDIAVGIALGPAVPFAELKQRSIDHDHPDLRSGAVLAVMRSGDLDAVRRLLDRADVDGADGAFVSMVDRHLAGFQGSDLSRLVLDRIGRRRRVSRGEALYLSNTAREADAPSLLRWAAEATDAETARLLRLAADNARSR